MAEVVDDVALEQLVKDQFYLDIGFQQFRGVVEAVADRLRIERVFIRLQGIAFQHQLESFGDREQFVFELWACS